MQGKSRGTVEKVDEQGNVIERFPSLSKAAKVCNLDYGNLYRGIKTGKKRYGFYWRWTFDQ